MDREARSAARVYWRNQTETGPQRGYQPFPTRDHAELFRQLARTSSLPGALAWLHNPSDEVLDELLGRRPKSAPQDTSTAAGTVVGVVPSTTGVGDRYDARVGVTFAHLWQRFLDIQRHLEGTTAELYEMYGRIHFLPFFGDTDLGLVQRTEPLRVSDALTGAVYVDDWVDLMLTKPRLNNALRPIKDSKLSHKYIRNVHTVLKQALQLAVDQRPALLEINPAREIRLPKTDRREMFFLHDASAYFDLRQAMDKHFRPLLDFLVGTGARFGEAAGLLVRHLHLDAERPYFDIRMVLKWVRKKWKLGQPKTRSSVRRISLSPNSPVLQPPVEPNQFRSRKFVHAINRHSLVGSMGRVGAAGDNAAMESFFALLQKNVLNRRAWATRKELRIAIVTWIEKTYHRRRRQALLGRLTPVEYELIMKPAVIQAA